MMQRLSLRPWTAGAVPGLTARLREAVFHHALMVHECPAVHEVPARVPGAVVTVSAAQLCVLLGRPRAGEITPRAVLLPRVDLGRRGLLLGEVDRIGGAEHLRGAILRGAGGALVTGPFATARPGARPDE